MTVFELEQKITASGDYETVNLDALTSGGSADDFTTNGTIARIIKQSLEGKKPRNITSKRSAFFICESYERVNSDPTHADYNKVRLVGAVQVFIATFDKSVTPYVKLEDGSIVRDKSKDILRAGGTAVISWKSARSIKAFVECNMGKFMGFTKIGSADTRKWDPKADNNKGAWSTTELKEDVPVYNVNWLDVTVEGETTDAADA